MIIKMTEEEAEIVLLALEYFRKDRLHEYDAEDRPLIAGELGAIEKKIREA